MDKEKITKAVELFLEGIGEDINREGLKDTPKRITAMCEEIFGGMNAEAKEHLDVTFSSEQSDMVVEKDILFHSVCEHHLLPFFGKVCIGYIPNGKVVGLSKLARTVEVYARRPQIQEQMTAQIAEAIMDGLKPKGVMVCSMAEHMCMSMRGVKKAGTITSTYVTKGVFEQDYNLQKMFMERIR